MLANDLPVLFKAKDAVKQAQELARKKNRLGSSLQCSVLLVILKQCSELTPNCHLFQRYRPELDALFVISTISIRHYPLPKNLKRGKWRYFAESEIYPPAVAKFGSDGFLVLVLVQRSSPW
jgi:hypothetical protein